MKLLVPAFYAQFRVGAGRVDLRAAHNGMCPPTRLSWRSFFVVLTQTKTHYGSRIKPIMRYDLLLWIV